MTTSKALFNVPPGATAQVHIIDTTSHVTHMPTKFLLAGPEIQGFENFPPLGSWSFLIQSSNGQKAVFDLGVPPDVNSLPPAVVNLLKETGVKFEATKHVAEILKENNVDRTEIGSVIWRSEK